MSSESNLIARLRALATHPAARGLNDDAAVIAPPLGRDLVLTHDMLAEGVHYLPTDPPGDVAWKLLAVNLSDLAGKGAIPIGVLMGFTLTGDPLWDDAFIDGLGRALHHFGVALLGGDTVSINGPRVLGLTAIGQVPSEGAPARSGAQTGDDLWITGTIGDAGLGLKMALGQMDIDSTLLKRYRLPQPRLAAGRALAPIVSAMMDVSDGLLIDALRMGIASDRGIRIDLNDVPLSLSFISRTGKSRDARLAAVVAGDDYELLFCAAPQHRQAVLAVASAERLQITCIGTVDESRSLSLFDNGKKVILPDVLGWEHDNIK